MAEIIGNTTATSNLQADWNQTDDTKSDYIKNKPDLDEYATHEYLASQRNIPLGIVYLDSEGKISTAQLPAEAITFVDDQLKDTSENPVQNKVLAPLLNGLRDDVNINFVKCTDNQNSITELTNQINGLYDASASHVMMFMLDEDGETVVVVYGNGSGEKSTELASPQYVDNAIQELRENIPTTSVGLISEISNNVLTLKTKGE